MDKASQPLTASPNPSSFRTEPNAIAALQNFKLIFQGA